MRRRRGSRRARPSPRGGSGGARASSRRGRGTQVTKPAMRPWASSAAGGACGEVEEGAGPTEGEAEFGGALCARSQAWETASVSRRRSARSSRGQPTEAEIAGAGAVEGGADLAPAASTGLDAAGVDDGLGAGGGEAEAGVTGGAGEVCRKPADDGRAGGARGSRGGVGRRKGIGASPRAGPCG